MADIGHSIWFILPGDPSPERVTLRAPKVDNEVLRVHLRDIASIVDWLNLAKVHSAARRNPNSPKQKAPNSGSSLDHTALGSLQQVLFCDDLRRPLST